MIGGNIGHPIGGAYGAWRRAIAGASSFTLTGVASLRHLAMNSVRGVFTFTGIAAVLQASRGIVAVAGAFVWRGFRVDLDIYRWVRQHTRPRQTDPILFKTRENQASLAQVRETAARLFRRRST
jgi:hypothetical protein